ncbi:hypothetical protein DV735_g2181, partial [Chaetothyriales sp. CBS 134920]
MSSSWLPGPTPYTDKLDNRAPPQPELGPPPHYPQPVPYPPPPPSREGAVYPQDPAYSRQNSVSGPSRSPAEPPRHQYLPPVSTPHEGAYYAAPAVADYPRPPHAYGPPPEHQPNGNHAPLHLQTGPEMMHAAPGAPPPPHPGYGPPPSAGPPPTPGAYPWQYDDRSQRRRPVRAAQACDSCRQRKAKCDEGRPECQHCKDNNLKCTYREIPPQKSEKQVLAITERLEGLSDQISQLASTQKAELASQLASQNEKIDAILRELSNQGLLALGNLPLSQSRGTTAVGNEPTPMKREESQPQQTPQAQDPNVSFVSDKPATNEGDTALEFSMPLEHTTGVHNLMEWPSIRALIPPNQSITYVMDVESSRGTLRLYGSGEGDDKVHPHEGVPSPAPSASSEGRRTDDETSSLPSQSFWGNGQILAQPLPENQLTKDHPGGLSPGGGLMLDSHVVDKYFRGYMDNMHILHPFLEPRVMRNLVQSFKRKYSRDLRVPRPSVGSKRKRDLAESPSSLDESSAYYRAQHPSVGHGDVTTDIEHSMSNAIVLLVLALGKICLHKQPLPGPVSSATSVRTTIAPQQHVYYSDFPPRVTASTPDSPFKEGIDVNGGSPPLAASVTGHGQLKNMDVIPGLAYFAKAADILGEFPGGAEISHVQANLLAGLYMGQLARVFASYHYISVACNACQILIKSSAYQEGNEQKMSKPQRNLINFAFWSCLQLESDILAEADLPPSGITRYEGRQHQEMPTGITLDPITQPGGQNDILRFYSYQVQLRRTLNEIHLMLYEKGKKAAARKSPTLSLINILNENLENWRSMLNSWDWDDNDHKHPDINVARMRGKYYGGKYIIHRPCLQWLLTDSVPVIPGSQHSGSPHGAQGSPPYPPGLQPAYSPPGKDQANTEMGPPGKVADARSYQRVLECARKCVHAAIRSTTAFDAVPPRPIITNVFGTAHAQFGNMLVLSATYTSSRKELKQLIPEPLFRALMDRTIKLLHSNTKISPILAEDATILRYVKNKIFPQG